MSVSRDEWLRQRREARAAQPEPRIVSCEVRGREGHVEVTIRGHDLAPLSNPVRVVVGEQQLTDLRFRGRDEITGTAAQLPTTDRVTVDLGPAQATGAVTGVHRDREPPRLWRLLRELFRSLRS
jgi:hypothetical protein